MFRNCGRIGTFLRKDVLHDRMTTCIILHNMIIEDERVNAQIEVARKAPPLEVEMAVDDNTRFQEFIAWYRQIKDKQAHFALQNALIDHLWEEYTNSDA